MNTLHRRVVRLEAKAIHSRQSLLELLQALDESHPTLGYIDAYLPSRIKTFPDLLAELPEANHEFTCPSP